MTETNGFLLLRAWEQYKQDHGHDLRGFAENQGLPYNSCRMKLNRAAKRFKGEQSLTPTGANRIKRRRGDDSALKSSQGEDRHSQDSQAGPSSPQADSQDLESIKVDRQANYMTLESGLGRRILSLDDLLEAAKVDLTLWEVERYVINKWEVGAKTDKKSLTWEDGVIIKGNLESSGGLTVEPLIQVKAWLIRTAPVAINPTIQPVNITLPQPGALVGAPSKAPRGTRTHRDAETPGRWGPGWERALIIPDTQFGFTKSIHGGAFDPFHDRAALDIILQVAERNHFDRVVWLGDILDLPDWSDKFLRSPDFYFQTQAAIVEAAYWIGKIRQATPQAKTYMLEGNHDLRMKTAIMAHLAAAYQLRPATEINTPPALSVPRLLGLDGLGVEWVGDYPNGRVWLNDRLSCEHGNIARAGPGETAKAMITASQRSVIFGHIHRLESAAKTIYDRAGWITIRAQAGGCLCRLDGVVPGHDLRQQTGWQQGFTVAYYHPGGAHYIEAYQIESGETYYQGLAYRAQDRLGELRQATGWEF